MSQENVGIVRAVYERWGEGDFRASLDVGIESGAETDLRYFQVWLFRGRKVIRLENFRERAEALEAAGLRE